MKQKKQYPLYFILALQFGSLYSKNAKKIITQAMNCNLPI